MDAATIAAALLKARPITAPGTYPPGRQAAVKGQYVGWRYAVVKMADALQSAHGSQFNRREFNAACGADSGSH